LTRAGRVHHRADRQLAEHHLVGGGGLLAELVQGAEGGGEHVGLAIATAGGGGAEGGVTAPFFRDFRRNRA
jgi:hypothetical protein